jgi:hypothetical protein
MARRVRVTAGMMSLPLRFFAVVIATATLSVGCAAEPVGEDLAALSLSLSGSDARAAWFQKHVELYGETSYGASTPGIPFNKGDKRYKSFSFVGQAGDKVSVRVWAPDKGDAEAWILDDKFKILAFNDNETAGSKDARIDLTLHGVKKQPKTYYLVYADKHRRNGTAFATDVQGPCGDTTSLCAADQIVDTATCTCVTPPPAPIPVEVDPALLVGAWQMSVADGPVYTFDSDGSLRLDCSGNVAGTWALDDTKYTINATLGTDPSSMYTVQWIALELDADHLAFYEGGDVFHFTRGSCP